MPITALEIRRALPASTTSAGPDSLTARFLRKVLMEILERILNIILWCEKAPAHLVESATTLILKKYNVHTPSDFRPITVSSVLLRTLHKVLATRMARLIHIDQRQRAFRPTDSCSENVFLLDLILRYHHRHHKPLFVASLDVAKAFDSVSHRTIEEILLTMGIPSPIRSYIMDVYQ
ncbi:reverse transcriptase [Lasius niger]|uniref:Reverse transcriptase n=1 Tax=Lasius niger TaxID=67767 RepID=A0A0J7KP62_LASNI|nr:reverse transcriptase [Lasius niger]